MHFLLRALPQYLYLSDLPRGFPSPPQLRLHEYFLTVFLSCLVVVLLHVFSDAPSAGEAVRFYLHGGLLIDFVGERGPISKTRLVLMDGLVLVLQLVQMAVHGEQVRSKKFLQRTPTPEQDLSGSQDLGALERGEGRQLGDMEHTLDLLSLGVLGPEVNHESRAAVMEDALHTPGRADAAFGDHVLDPSYTGQSIIVNVQVFALLRRMMGLKAKL